MLCYRAARFYFWVCRQQGYRFFMIALKDVEVAERIVREIRGLLPAVATA